MFAASKSGSVEAKDAQFNYVTMLLHGDGTNGAQNNTFLDSSTNNFTITRNGNTTQGTFTPYGDNWSNYMTSGYLTTASNADFALSADFTVQCWVFSGDSSLDGSTRRRIFHTGGGDVAASLQLLLGTSAGNSAVISVLNSGFLIDGTISVVTSSWNHVAVTRSGTSLKLFVNGVQSGSTATTSQNFNSGTSNTVYIGANSSGGGIWQGYISNLSVVNGTALYTSAFTPPTAPLSTGTTNQKLLVCQVNRFIDSNTATTAKTITVNSTPSVQRFSPFSPTTAYSTSVIGGSGYFDGTGDVLTVADNAALQLGSGDFSIEFWMWKNSTYSISGANFQALVISPSGVANSYEIQTHGPTNTLALGIATVSNIVSYATSNFVPYAFYHVVFTRSGNAFRMFVNGVLVSYATNTINFTSGNGTAIGGYTSSRFWDGFITDVRIIKGSIPTTYQTSATSTPTNVFTPPSSPVTTTSQGASSPSLLCNFTNAGILDNAMMNDLETVGNAQISTSIKKYGTGSLAFDGSGDCLDSQSTPNLALTTGDFTIEQWVYWDSSKASIQIIFDWRPASTNGVYPMLYINTDGTLNYYVSSTVRITTSAITANTWTYVGVVRYSGTTKIYVNGTQSGSSYTDANNYLQSRVRIGNSGFSLADGFDFKGYIDDLRITKGVARYTATFTAPTAAFPNN